MSLRTRHTRALTPVTLHYFVQMPLAAHTKLSSSAKMACRLPACMVLPSTLTNPLDFRVRTLPEVLQLAMNSTRSGRPVGVYIETKGPAFHTSIGLPLETKLLDALMAAGYGDTAAAPLILQSFEPQVTPDICEAFLLGTPSVLQEGVAHVTPFMHCSCSGIVTSEEHSRLHSPSSLLASGLETPTNFSVFACSRLPTSNDCCFVAQLLQNMSRELEARGLPGRADMVWLLDCRSNITDADLDAFARYGHGIGPEKVWPTSCHLLAAAVCIAASHGDLIHTCGNRASDTQSHCQYSRRQSPVILSIVAADRESSAACKHGNAASRAPSQPSSRKQHANECLVIHDDL